MSPNGDGSSKSRAEVRTSGRVFRNGTILDLVRLSASGDSVGLLHWDGKRASVAPSIEIGDKIYRARELQDRLVAFFDRYTGLQFGDLQLTALFVLASWFPEFTPGLIRLLLCAPFPTEAPSALRALRCVCRHGLLVGDLTVHGFMSLPLSLRPTVILDQTNVSRRLAGVLRVSNTPDLFVARGADLVSPNCSQVVCIGIGDLDAVVTQGMLRVALTARRPGGDLLDERGIREAIGEIQPRLLGYRLRNFARVSTSTFDVADFPAPVREIARCLGSVIVDDDALRREVSTLLNQQAEDTRAQTMVTPEFALVVAILAYLHSKERKFVAVRLLATATNAVLRSFGEILEFSPPEIGYRLANLGLYTRRTASAKVLSLDRETSRKAHEFARRLGVPLPDGGFPGCPDCGTPAQATGKAQLVQGVQGV